MYVQNKKQKSTQNTAAQPKETKGIALQDNREHSNATTQLVASNIIQKKDMYYWVVSRGHKQYVGSFKSHAAANAWWAENKSSYEGYTFGRGSSATKYR